MAAHSENLVAIDRKHQARRSPSGTSMARYLCRANGERFRL